jgi:peptidoglycan/LPS O-acetylase OafA/YrhL
MRKIAHDHHPPFRAADLFLPIVTLGFYGLRRFRPRWLYAVTALLVLAAWVCLAYFASTIQTGGEYLVAPAVFVMVIVTFFRLAPPGKGRAATHR